MIRLDPLLRRIERTERHAQRPAAVDDHKVGRLRWKTRRARQPAGAVREPDSDSPPASTGYSGLNTKP